MALDTHLVDIDKLEENDFVSKVAEKGSLSRFWIALNDLEIENRFVTSNNSTPTYLHWYIGEPNDGDGTEDCVEIILGSSDSKPFNGRWNDRACTDVEAFVCESARSK